jgi:hypothetical protein
MARVPVNDKIARTAKEIIKSFRTYGWRKQLRQIVNGEVKYIDPEWWRHVNNNVNKPKLDKVRAMADSARNPNEHERRSAETVLAKLQTPSAPGLEDYDREEARLKAMQARVKPKPEPVSTKKPSVNTTKSKAKPKPKPESVNTTKPRSADRHLEPNRDRHSPGYMRDYMRRRRAAQKR